MKRHGPPLYWLGAVCWAIIVHLWPILWLHRSPRWLWIGAWLYAEDERQHEKAGAKLRAVAG